MSFNDSVSWIKTAEARKTPEKTVKSKLKKSGWSESDINLAVKIAHKGKVHWMLLVIAFVIGLISMLLLQAEFDEFFIFHIFTVFFSLIYALVPHQDNESYFHSLILIYTSTNLALLSINFIYNLLVKVTMEQIMHNYILIVLLNAIIVMVAPYFFYSYLSFLSKRFLGYFDHHAYFSFKHWPVKIFTVNWKKKWTLLSYCVPLALAAAIVIVIFGLSLTSSIDEKMSEYQNNIHFAFESSLENICRQKIPLFTDPDNEISVYKSPGDELFFKVSDLQGVDQLFLDCDFLEKKCITKKYSNFLSFQEQVTLPQGESIIYVFENETTRYALIQIDRNLQEAFDCSQLTYDFTSPLLEEISKARQEEYQKYITIPRKSFSLLNLKPYKEYYAAQLTFSIDFLRINRVYADAFEVLEQLRTNDFSTGINNFTKHMVIVTDNVNYFHSKILPPDDSQSSAFVEGRFSWWSSVETFRYLWANYFSPFVNYQYQSKDWNPRLWEYANGENEMDANIALIILEQRLSAHAMDSCRQLNDQQCIEEIQQRAEGRLIY
jgi:hypothetical protein